MKLFITGANGQLGNSLKRALASRYPDAETLYTDIDDLDLTDKEMVEATLLGFNPDVIINCAAYTAVDRAESEGQKAQTLNVEVPAHLASLSRKIGAKLLHISTDYVFSGEVFRPYMENDEPHPRSIYGSTKLDGEGLVTSFAPDSIIIRTAWLYSEYGNNFVKTMLRLASENGQLNVVADQIGTPTYAADLANVILDIIFERDWTPGIYHFTNEGVASWYDFAVAIMELTGNTDVEVKPILTKDYPTPAKRPPYSLLNKCKIKNTFNVTIPYWRSSLAKMLSNLNR